MSVKTAIGGKVLSTVLTKLKESEPVTTISGATVASVIAANIDYSKLLQGDPTQIGLAIGAVATGVLGYYTNHSKVVNPAPKQ